MKRWIAGAAAVCLAAVLAFPVRAISARQAILLDAQTGRVLYEKNADRRGLIASTTKIMTALLICEQCNVCLLYTSPSPRDGLLSRMPSSA